jgi:glycosyltransferase involved in cell wall biosynthesis
LDVWNPSARVSVPRRVFARALQEIQRADVVLCASTYVRDSMLQNGVPESKLAVNPFGVDLRVFAPRERLPETPRFLFVGGLTLRKGLQYLVPAFERLRAEYPRAELILCGQLCPDFEPWYEKWRPWFTHHPSLPHAELALLMRSCTAFVFPSVEEGFARVIAEAMGAGLPVVATHNSGATTVVEDGKQGLIVPTGSAEPVYLAMRRLIEQPPFCEALGRQAAAKMAAEGSWSCYARKLLSVYESCSPKK